MAIQRPEDVSAIQETLNKLGYDTGSVDGMWGKNTSAGFNEFVHDIQTHMFPDDPAQQDGLYGPRTQAELEAHIQEMYGDKLSPEEMRALTVALGHMVEPVDAQGRPDPNGTPLINRLHRPQEVGDDFVSKITPAPVAAPAPVVDATGPDMAPAPGGEDAPVIGGAEDVTPADATAVLPDPQTPDTTPVIEDAPDAPAAGIEITAGPIEPHYTQDWSDDDIAASAVEITGLAVTSSTSTMTGDRVYDKDSFDFQADALDKLDALRDETDPAKVAQGTVEILEGLDDRLAARQLEIVTENPELQAFVREKFPDVGDSPEDVLAKLREPGVMDTLLSGHMNSGMQILEMRGPMGQLRALESERVSADRIHDVMEARLPQTAPDAVVETDPADLSPEEQALARMAAIEAQQAQLMTHNYLQPGNPEDCAADSVRAQERIENMRDPVKFQRLRDHLLAQGNTEGVAALDEFKTLENERAGLQAGFEQTADAGPAAADPAATPAPAPAVTEQVVRATVGLG